MIENTVLENHAPTNGGGLYVQGSYLALERNDILSNTAYSGAGLDLAVNSGLVKGNNFQGNASGWRGGGIYLRTATLFEDNLFIDNTATIEGGGAFVIRDGGAVFRNSVFVGNHAATGSAMYLWASKATLIHSTIANNISADGCAVVVDKYPGLILPGDPTLYTATVEFSNTIISNQTTGFYATADNSLMVDGILWYATPTHFQATGADLTVRNEFTGDPAFQPDGYHLRLHSAARDKTGSALESDVDGHLRDYGNMKDLGADEYIPTVVIDPDLGGTLTYTNPEMGVEIWIEVPPKIITCQTVMQFSPQPPYPPDVLDSPFGKFVAVGPPFRLDPFLPDTGIPITDTADPPLGEPSPPLTFGYPAEVWLKYDPETLRKLHEGMDFLTLQLLAMINDDPPTPPWNPACGPVDHDLENSTLEVPICNTGIPSSTVQSAYLLPLKALATDFRQGTFMFVVEIEESKLYLPMILR